MHQQLTASFGGGQLAFMLKRQAAPTGPEKRARRIRAAFLSIFAAFLLLILLAISWLLTAFHRENPQMAIHLDKPSDGVFIFDIQALGSSAARALAEDDQDAAQALDRDLERFQSFLGPRGQLFLWGDDQDELGQWLAFIPIRKTNRYVYAQLGVLLTESPLFTEPSDPSPDPDMLGYYQLTPAGLILSSHAEPPPFTILPGTIPAEHPFEYQSRAGFILPRWRTHLGDQEVEAIVWSTQSNDQPAETRLQVSDGEWRALPFFDPLFPVGLQ